MHLSPEYGWTYRNIENDGFSISAKVDMLLSSDSPAGIAKSIGIGVIGCADALARLKPDILVVLGDRFESFAAAQAALVERIPIAHIHGGEATEGLIDEAIRHSITKMATYHFVAAEPYRRRVIQLGESADHVFNYGAPGLDNLNRLKLLNRGDFEKSIGFPLGRTSFLVTYHPVTLSESSPAPAMRELLRALSHFVEARIIFTKANADTEGRVINSMIDEYTIKHSEQSKSFVSMGSVLYLSALSHADVIIGNSSSGIIEAPALKKATVNIGARQQGRLRAASIIDCRETEDEIIRAIEKALSPSFQELLQGTVSPYGEGNASARIKDCLKRALLKDVLIKRFHDIPTFL